MGFYRTEKIIFIVYVMLRKFISQRYITPRRGVKFISFFSTTFQTGSRDLKNDGSYAATTTKSVESITLDVIKRPTRYFG